MDNTEKLKEIAKKLKEGKIASVPQEIERQLKDKQLI